MATSRIPHNKSNFNPQIERGLRLDFPRVGARVFCACCDREFTYPDYKPAVYLQPRAEKQEIGAPIGAVLCPHCFAIAERGGSGLRRIGKKVMRNNRAIFDAVGYAVAALHLVKNGGGE